MKYGKEFLVKLQSLPFGHMQTSCIDYRAWKKHLKQEAGASLEAIMSKLRDECQRVDDVFQEEHAHLRHAVTLTTAYIKTHSMSEAPTCSTNRMVREQTYMGTWACVCWAWESIMNMCWPDPGNAARNSYDDQEHMLKHMASLDDDCNVTMICTSHSCDDDTDDDEEGSPPWQDSNLYISHGGSCSRRRDQEKNSYALAHLHHAGCSCSMEQLQIYSALNTKTLVKLCKRIRKLRDCASDPQQWLASVRSRHMYSFLGDHRTTYLRIMGAPSQSCRRAAARCPICLDRPSRARPTLIMCCGHCVCLPCALRTARYAKRKAPVVSEEDWVQSLAATPFAQSACPVCRCPGVLKNTWDMYLLLEQVC
jgi:hypothetical protein